MPAACDRCYQPGACCKNLTLSGPGIGDISFESVRRAGGRKLKVQLVPPAKLERKLRDEGLEHFRIMPDARSPDGAYLFWCTRLQPDGRCGAYQQRPDICRSFKEGMDPLCVHYSDPDGTFTGGEGVDLVEGRP